MITIQSEDLPKDWWAYLQKVQAGETLLVLQADKPVAKIQPVITAAQHPRPFGLCAGEFSVPDDFDAPLPEHILSAFDN